MANLAGFAHISLERSIAWNAVARQDAFISASAVATLFTETMKRSKFTTDVQNMPKAILPDARSVKGKFLSAKEKSCCSEGGSPSRPAPSCRQLDYDQIRATRPEIADLLR